MLSAWALSTISAILFANFFDGVGFFAIFQGSDPFFGSQLVVKNVPKFLELYASHCPKQ